MSKQEINQYPGVTVKYSDTVPDGAVNIAYVSALMDNPNSVISLSDDLIDVAKYNGNATLTPGYSIVNGPVYTLTAFRNQVVDPLTGVSWLSFTDNSLFTSVSTTITDTHGVVQTVPLFYKQELRFPIPPEQLPLSVFLLIQGGIPLELTLRPDPTMPVIDTLALIHRKNGKALPKGYLYKVMLDRVDNDGNLYISVYTNFQSSYKENFMVKWATYSETLNVNPAYFQSLTNPDYSVFVATPAIETLTLQQQLSISNSDSPSIVLAQRPPVRQSAVYANSAVTSIDTTTNVPLASSLGTGSYTAGYYDNEDGFKGIAQFGSPNWMEYYFAHSTVYTTHIDTAAPVDALSAISVALNGISCAQTAYGDGYVLLTIIDPLGNQVLQSAITNQAPRVVIVNGQPITTGLSNAIYVPDSTYLASYFSQGAISGEYTIYIGGISDGSYNVYSNIQLGPSGQPGIFTFPIAWQGQYSWSEIQGNNYSVVPGLTTNFYTPDNTQAPASSATELQLNITGINAPVSSFLATYFNVTLTSPTSGVVLTQTGLTAPTTITYMGSGGPGTWLWSVWADGTLINPGIDDVDCTLSGRHFYTLIDNSQATYVGKSGIAATYVTASNTIAPTGPERALELDLSSVSCPLSIEGFSSLEVTLRDPSGKKVFDQSGITTPQILTYQDLAAQSGPYTWSVIGNATANPNASATDIYSDTWSGDFTYYIPDNSDPTMSNQPSGFNFVTKITDGPFWGTTDIGPQIYMRKPDSIDTHENWYLRIHRGWLFYTDQLDNQYLVGLAPYYQQNFDKFIPIYKCQKEKAEILSPTSIRVKNRPLLIDHRYPIDIIVTRTFINGTSQNIWITRDNQKSSGNYLPSAISDILGARGELEVSNIYLLASDVVHVTYDYIENYFTYTGFADAFGRWLHLDLNPAGGHTYTNIWDSPSALTPVNVAPASGTSQPSIQFSKSQVTTLLPDASQVVAAVSTPTIKLSTMNSGGPLYQTETYNYASTGLVVVESVTGDNSSQLIAGNGNVSINVHGVAHDSNTTSQSFNVTAAPLSSGTEVSVIITTLNASSTAGPNWSAYPELDVELYDPNNVVVSTWNFANNNGPTPFNLPWTSTYSASAALAGIYKLKIFAHPIAGGEPLPQSYNVAWAGAVDYYINPVTTYGDVNSPTVDISTPIETSAPKSASTAISFTLTGLTRAHDTNGAIKLGVNLYDPSGKLQATNAYTSAPQVISYYRSGALAGQYTWSIYGIVSDTGQSTAEYPISAVGYISYYNPLFTIGQIFNEKDGQAININTANNTAAPVDNNTSLNCKIAGLSVEDSISGEAVYDVSLANSNGATVEQWSNITKGTNLVYYDPNAMAGKYKWSISPTAYILNNSFMQQNFGNEVITCQGSGAQKGWYQVGSTTLTDTLAYDPTGTQLWASWIAFYNTINGSGPTIGLGIWDANNNIVLASMVGTSSTGTIQFVSGTGPVLPQRPNINLTGASTLGTFTSSGINASGPNVNTLGIWPANNPSNWKLALYNNNSVMYNGTINLPGTSILTPPFSPFLYCSTVNDLYVRSYFINEINPVVTNPSTYTFDTETFSCSASASATWQDAITQQTITYANKDGKPTYYKTDKFTAAPLSEDSQLTLKLSTVKTPSDTYGSSYITVQLQDPASNIVGSWTNITHPITLTYSSSGTAISGQYLWSVEGQCNNSKNGISSYDVSWAGKYEWFEYVSVNSIGQNPTVELVNKGVYMYLTQTGYPFHAVLDIGDDPDRPLLYDTHGALDGTIYSTVPTVHSDL